LGWLGYLRESSSSGATRRVVGGGLRGSGKGAAVLMVEQLRDPGGHGASIVCLGEGWRGKGKEEWRLGLFWTTAGFRRVCKKTVNLLGI
jgi:hypothetical protein